MLLTALLTCVATAAVCYLVFYFSSLVSVVELHCNDNAWTRSVLSNCSLLRKWYWPPLFCFNRNLNGLLLMKLRAAVDPLYTREVIYADDGASLELDWAEDATLPLNAPVLLMLSGVTGNSRSSYITNLMVQARKRGWRGVVLNYPSASGSPLTAPRFFCLDSVSDTKQFVEHVHTRYADAPLIALGFSLGAHFFMKYLEECPDSPLMAAALVSSPWAAETCYDFWQGQWVHENLYDKHFLNRFQGDFKKNLEIFQKLPYLDVERILNCKTTMEFHEALSVPLFRFNSIDDYWDAYDSSKHLNKVKLPYFVLHAWNDPVVPPNAVPLSRILDNPNAIFAATRAGGHTGWLSPLRFWGPSWAERVLMQYVEGVLATGLP